MREALDQMLFVYGAYGVTIALTSWLVVSSWLAMRKAEKKREEARSK